MSDEQRPLPPLTEADWHGLIQMLLGLTVFGCVTFDVHPSRWDLIVDAARRFGGAIPEHVPNDQVLKLPLDIEAEGLPIRAVLRRWEPCAVPIADCAACQRIQAQRYPEPEEEKLIQEPDRRTGIIMPGDPRALRRKLH